MLRHGQPSELRESSLEVRQFEGVRPVVLVGSAEHLEDLEDLVNFTVSREERSLLSHLSEDAASAPQVNSK